MSTRSVIGIGCLLALAFFLCFCLPRFLVAGFTPDPDKPNDKIRLENEVRTSMIQLVAGLFVAGSLIVGYRNLKTLQDRNLTERFAKAVEQLGDETSAVRLGGIVSLERIARESKRDYVAVMELLCAYVRENSRNANHREAIKAVMLLIGRRSVERRKSSRPLNLTAVDLHDIDLSAGNYARITFVGAQFSDSKLAGNRFDDADLSDCVFDRADLTQAVLNDAILRRASFSNTKLFGAKLRRADCSGAALEGASLWASDLTEANFTGAKLVEASLLHATLERANVRGADLTGAVVLSSQLNSTSGSPAKLPSPSAFKIRKTPQGQLSILHNIAWLPIGPESPVHAAEFLTVFYDGLSDLRWPDATEIPHLPRTVVSPRATIDGTEVSITYSGVAPTSPAIFQINLHVPPDLLPGEHSLEIVVDRESSGVIKILSVPAC